jgi:hypothetical protein
VDDQPLPDSEARQDQLDAVEQEGTVVLVQLEHREPRAVRAVARSHTDLVGLPLLDPREALGHHRHEGRRPADRVRLDATQETSGEGLQRGSVLGIDLLSRAFDRGIENRVAHRIGMYGASHRLETRRWDTLVTAGAGCLALLSRGRRRPRARA